MSDIPQEIITEILTWLPVKSLLRFRCVSKPWNVLIDSLMFIKLHLNQTLKSNSEQKLLISGQGLYSADFDSMIETNIAKFEVIALPYFDSIRINIAKIHISGCGNGLVCLWLTNSRHQGIILLWNPSIGKLRLPNFGEACFAYDVCFGYDTINDDYKVVKIVQSQNSRHARLSVYSLRSNALVKVQAFPYRCSTANTGSGAVFVAGGLHWRVNVDLHNQNIRIVAFNLTTEKTQLVPEPDCCSTMDFDMNLAVLGGSLSSVYYYNEIYDADIWIMKEYGKKESWTKIASINNSGSMTFRYLSPISFSKSGKQILLGINNEDLVCYNLEDKSTNNVEIQGHHGMYYRYGVYSESLVR